MNSSSMANPVGEEMSVINSTLFCPNEHKVAAGMGPIITNDQAVSPCLFYVNRHWVILHKWLWHSYMNIWHRDMLKYLKTWNKNTATSEEKMKHSTAAVKTCSLKTISYI